MAGFWDKHCRKVCFYGKVLLGQNEFKVVQVFIPVLGNIYKLCDHPSGQPS